MLYLSSFLLAATIVVAVYVTNVCSISPNPPPALENRHEKDSLISLVGAFNTCLRRIMFPVTIYHAILSVFSGTANFQNLCPYVENTNPEFFSWSNKTMFTLTIMFVGGVIRLSAFSGLGKNFTFHLEAPDRLVTTGVYQYMQHPSYTGWFLIIIGMHSFFMRWDAAPGCLIPSKWLASLDGWGVMIIIIVLGRFANNVRQRVQDEEEMLSGVFGKKMGGLA